MLLFFFIFFKNFKIEKHVKNVITLLKLLFTYKYAQNYTHEF